MALSGARLKPDPLSRSLERIFRQLEADPAQAEAWLKQQSGLSLIPTHLKSVARLLDEVRTRPEVLLCLWHLGISGSAKRAFDILSEGMMAPRHQADLARLRQTLNAYRGPAESVDGPTVPLEKSLSWLPPQIRVPVFSGLDLIALAQKEPGSL